ncbi:hypothetical protein NC651_038601 [Populus alba x Populus x berolinensis]|nr:hypothetical protein NC651_038601 [Populus alba x Populus x berolinensis]
MFCLSVTIIIGTIRDDTVKNNQNQCLATCKCPILNPFYNGINLNGRRVLRIGSARIKLFHTTLQVIFVSVPDTLCSRSMLQNARILGNSRVSRSTILSGICASYGCRKFSKGFSSFEE